MVAASTKETSKKYFTEHFSADTNKEERADISNNLYTTRLLLTL